jgi:hypothetical protein
MFVAGNNQCVDRILCHVADEAAQDNEAKAKQKNQEVRMNDQVRDVLDEVEDWASGKLWGATEIAASAGVSVDTVRRWAADPSCPISKPHGRLFVTRRALKRWLERK